MSRYPEGKFERHPLNVPGPFYVEEGQCIACLGPCQRAADLIGYFEPTQELRGYSHCYVKKQPGTPEELEQMINAIGAACCSGLRYCGSDPSILERLQQAGLGGRCDELWEDTPEPTGSSAGG